MADDEQRDHDESPRQSRPPRRDGAAGGYRRYERGASGSRGGERREGGRSGGYQGGSRGGERREGGRSGGYQGGSRGGERRESGYQRSSGSNGGNRSDRKSDQRGGYRGSRDDARSFTRGVRDDGQRGGFRRDAVRRDDRRSEREDGSRRGDRSVNRPVIEVPEIPEEISIGQLDRTVRARLRTLSKDNAEDVGRHLVMAGLLMDVDPERAYKHAQVAAQRAGRVDVVREAAALTAYVTGRYSEALRELRTVRRLNGSHEHLPLMADCERGLGRPERAIALSREPEAAGLDTRTRIELDIVVAGARMDLGDAEAALVSLGRLETSDHDLSVRIAAAQVAALRALGRSDEAAVLEATIPVAGPVTDPWADEVVLYDVAEIELDEIDGQPADGDASDAGDLR